MTDDKNILNGEELEKVTGGYSKVTTYSFQYYDTFRDGAGRYYVVIKDHLNVDGSYAVTCDVHDVKTALFEHVFVPASILDTYEFIGTGKECLDEMTHGDHA